jgi:hypothetical protein
LYIKKLDFYDDYLYDESSFLKTIVGALNNICVAGGGAGRGDGLEDKIFNPSRNEESRVIY